MQQSHAISRLAVLVEETVNIHVKESLRAEAALLTYKAELLCLAENP